MHVPRGGEDDVAVSGQEAGTSPGAGLDLSAAMVRAESGAPGHDTARARQQAVLGPRPEDEGLTAPRSLRRLIGDLPYINDLHRRSDPIQEIVVVVDPDTYWLHADHGLITCGRDVSSIERGAVKEELSFSAWATALFDQIAQQNLVNHDSIVALRHLVEQDRVD